MLTSYEEFVSKHRAEEFWLTKQLLDLGMPQHLKGFQCAVIMIAMCVEHPEYLHAITTELYPATARVLGGNASAVERALRNAVEVAWTYGDPERQHIIFGNSVNAAKGKPTNIMFISTMYYKMRRELVICGKQNASSDTGFLPIS